MRKDVETRMEDDGSGLRLVMTNITSGHKGPAHPLAMAERPTASSKKRMPPLLSIPSHAPTAVGRRRGRLAV